MKAIAMSSDQQDQPNYRTARKINFRALLSLLISLHAVLLFKYWPFVFSSLFGSLESTHDRIAAGVVLEFTPFALSVLGLYIAFRSMRKTPRYLPIAAIVVAIAALTMSFPFGISIE